jgi:hypothetical protein
MVIVCRSPEDGYQRRHEKTWPLAGRRDLNLTACGPECRVERSPGLRAGDLLSRQCPCASETARIDEVTTRRLNRAIRVIWPSPRTNMIETV